jgi:subtilisin family serine protease
MAKKRFPRRPYQKVKFSLPPGFQESIVVELRYEAPVAAAKDRFVGLGEGATVADRLNEVLDQKDVAEIRPSFMLKPLMVKASLNLSAALPAAPTAAAVSTRIERAKDALAPESFFKSNFARVILKKKGDAEELAQRFKRHDAVWDAYIAPVPEPPIYFRPPDVPEGLEPFNLEPTQGYLYSAPDGIGACDVWDQKGARGEGVTICDIEAGWNLTHQDLPGNIKVLGGTPLSDPEWVNHGTAVLGEMVSTSNSVGTVGIAHRAKAVVQSAVMGSVFNPSQAIDNAASKLKPGDVILIELHSELHEHQGDYVAMQYFSEVFTAIQATVNNGIVVVAAAGNGNQDFNSASYNNTGLQKDCGAIVVGAGVPPSNRVDFNGFGSDFPSYTMLGAPRSRIFFSNYGRIVNVQGWGWHVSSTGYGDAGGKTANEQYTLRFSGTSSASPIVTGAVACLQGAALQVRGNALTPAQVRKILIDTGTPQAANPGAPVSQNQIGPQPDLVAALKKL